MGGITSNQLDVATWQLATNLNGGYAALASNVVSGISITNAFITNSVFAGNGGGLTNLNVSASQLTSIGNTNAGAVGNFFVGPAGDSTASGEYNTAVGNHALVVVTNGSLNTAVGDDALGGESTGSANTAVGHTALAFDYAGLWNTAIGDNALSNLGYFGAAGGTNNIALGYAAGASITIGSSNIDIGNVGANGENNIIRIGTSQTATYLAGVINGNGGGLTNLNVSASQLTSIGNTNAGAVGNFFVGPAGDSTASGEYNTAVGNHALVVVTNGSVSTRPLAMMRWGRINRVRQHGRWPYGAGLRLCGFVEHGHR